MKQKLRVISFISSIVGLMIAELVLCIIAAAFEIIGMMDFALILSAIASVGVTIGILLRHCRLNMRFFLTAAVMKILALASLSVYFRMNVGANGYTVNMQNPGAMFTCLTGITLEVVSLSLMGIGITGIIGESAKNYSIRLKQVCYVLMADIAVFDVIVACSLYEKKNNDGLSNLVSFADDDMLTVLLVLMFFIMLGIITVLMEITSLTRIRDELVEEVGEELPAKRILRERLNTIVVCGFSGGLFFVSLAILGTVHNHYKGKPIEDVQDYYFSNKVSYEVGKTGYDSLGMAGDDTWVTVHKVAEIMDSVDKHNVVLEVSADRIAQISKPVYKHLKMTFEDGDMESIENLYLSINSLLGTKNYEQYLLNVCDYEIRLDDGIAYGTYAKSIMDRMNSKVVKLPISLAYTVDENKTSFQEMQTINNFHADDNLNRNFYDVFLVGQSGIMELYEDKIVAYEVSYKNAGLIIMIVSFLMALGVSCLDMKCIK